MELANPIVIISMRVLASSLENELPEEVLDQKDLMFCLWVFHYFYRAIVYPLRSSSRSNISIFLVVSAILFNVLNSYINGYALYFFNYQQPVDAIQFYFGVFLFVNGWFGNLIHDNYLLKLREICDNMKLHNHSEATIIKFHPEITKDDFFKTDEGRVYILPKKYLFKYITSPNYFCETLEWLGLFIATPSIASFLFFMNTFLTLADKAKHSNRWYRKKFSTYDRKAIIPFLY
ncbi:hypothetical protein CONCODRAFT_77364 [Conidiobolus coronatus NRRL 28638]|uniref:3-oxo-5-alpha-steroid 4-dehydrogenase C-terminal domain-containing protein n=1 Tax=Conidiobolus coronatus (strain ATCC 28846 / CBS 209.66 / NRRL 28638) TaxID=796925 RepID=A0A137PEK4_CONC2|nr:hypothetical protein CONCODRAFT_77364 [Conidiobolus coronatus NRRL 28638]|eukprot:KXN73405.1 hypothetical protein CONCODRAFT_77364 [Conidiobolus coronatus NRRL 28638]